MVIEAPHAAATVVAVLCPRRLPCGAVHTLRELEEGRLQLLPWQLWGRRTQQTADEGQAAAEMQPRYRPGVSDDQPLAADKQAGAEQPRRRVDDASAPADCYYVSPITG